MSQVISRILLAAVLLAPSFARALEVRGRLDRQGEHLRLISDQNVVYPLFPISAPLSQDLVELSSGDYLEATLEPLDEFSQYYLTQIHFVGVCRLVGLWIAENLSLVSVEGFNEILIYDRRIPRREPDMYQYILAPEDGPGWSIFLSQPGKVMTGRLRFVGENLNLKLWNKSEPRLELHLIPLHRLTSRAQTCP
jgi:hypothetical protein